MSQPTQRMQPPVQQQPVPPAGQQPLPQAPPHTGQGSSPNLRPQMQAPVGQAEMSPFKEFLTFRRMITPTIVTVIFWLGTIGTVLSGLFMLTQHVGIGLACLVLGPLTVRMYTELIMLGFRSYDVMREISYNTRR